MEWDGCEFSKIIRDFYRFTDFIENGFRMRWCRESSIWRKRLPKLRVFWRRYRNRLKIIPP